MPYVTTNNISLYYEIHGEGEPLVLILGLASDVGRWQKVIAELARHHRVIAFDNRGCGRTDKPDIPYSIEMMAEDTLGIMDALSVPKANFVGLSLGAQVAQQIAYRHPERVINIVLVAASPRVCPGDSVREGRIAQSVRCSASSWLVRRILARYPATRQSALRQAEAVLAFDSRSWAGGILAPVLIVNGDSDESVTVTETEAFAGMIPGAELEFFHGHHMTIGQKPEVWSRPALDFLARHTGQAR